MYSLKYYINNSNNGINWLILSFEYIYIFLRGYIDKMTEI